MIDFSNPIDVEIIYQDGSRTIYRHQTPAGAYARLSALLTPYRHFIVEEFRSKITLSEPGPRDLRNL